ncbi:hypothetical protein [Arthrobacter sp. ZGTC131]|nr:hypothetical protein [Arthrobacter sp. ZGTC131]
MTVSRRRVLLLGGLSALGQGVLSLPTRDAEVAAIRLNAAGTPPWD